MATRSKKSWLFLPAILFFHCSLAQSGVIKGRIFNPFSNEPLPYANIQLQGTSLFTLSDTAGNYTIKKITPGLYNLVVSSVGYKTKIVFEIQVDNLKPSFVDIPMESSADTIRQVEIVARTDRSIEWTRVHDLPDFVYFNHSIHVNKGVGCTTCHGQVDRMPLMMQEQSLQMEWCLDCHRNPERYVRPRDAVFRVDYEPPPDQIALGTRLVAQYQIQKLTSCSTCHR